MRKTIGWMMGMVACGGDDGEDPSTTAASLEGCAWE